MYDSLFKPKSFQSYLLNKVTFVLVCMLPVTYNNNLLLGSSITKSGLQRAPNTRYINKTVKKE